MFIKQQIDVAKKVAILTLNRPERLNAMTPEMAEELCAVLKKLNSRVKIRSIIISGEGKAFCAGSDLNARLANSTAQTSQGSDPYLLLIRKMNGLVEGHAKPVIAAMNGHAIGAGLELALACDMRIVAKSAKIGLTEVKVGAIAGGGGSQRLPRLIGMGNALELLLTGDRINGERAEAIGLVNRAVDDGKVMESALDLAGMIASNAPLSLKAVKQSVRRGIALCLEDALDVEMQLAGMIALTQDRAEGMKAFLEKRKPVFVGK